MNSPAISPVLKRWSLPPQHPVWLALIALLDEGPEMWLADGSPERDADVAGALSALGDEPYVIEAVSKVLAIVAPDVVPLMPLPARAFVLDERAESEPTSFVAMIHLFTSAARTHREALSEIGRACSPAPLGAGQVLDRLLWFDSEGLLGRMALARSCAASAPSDLPVSQ